MHNNVLHNFIFESDPKLIDLTESSIRGFNKILFIDSIFDFFPRVEVNFVDPNGVIPDQTYFLEDLEFTVELGNKTDGFLGGKYVWASNEFNDVRIENFLSGSNSSIFISKYINFNEQKNKSWLGTIKSTIENILTVDYSLTDSTKKFISNTTGSDYWYQSAEKNSEFIKNLSDYAYDIAHNKSPYYTFINSNEEFYFMNLYDLFNQQPINPVNPYTLENKEDSQYNLYSIQDYIIQTPGMELNIDNYGIKAYETSSSGVSSSEEYEYKDFVYKELNAKLLLRTQYNKNKTIFYKGINETIQDKYNYLGLINSFYRDSALSYRKFITIPFNPKIASGKLINLKLESAFETKGVLKEYSGNWLILKTLHHLDLDGIPYSNLLIAKSTLSVNSKHKFYPDFQ